MRTAVGGRRRARRPRGQPHRPWTVASDLSLASSGRRQRSYKAVSLILKVRGVHTASLTVSSNPLTVSARAVTVSGLVTAIDRERVCGERAKHCSGRA